MSWPAGYLSKSIEPTIWGGDGVLAGVFDVDPVYDHPDPQESEGNFAVYDNDLADDR